MSESEYDSDEIAFSTDDIYDLICGAVFETGGVLDLAGGVSDAITNILGRENKYYGVKIAGSDSGYTIDILVIIRYGERIPDIAWNIQKNVYKTLTDAMDIEIKDVNIHVQGVEEYNTEEGSEQEEG